VRAVALKPGDAEPVEIGAVAASESRRRPRRAVLRRGLRQARDDAGSREPREMRAVALGGLAC